MPKERRGIDAAIAHAEPMLVTAWEEFIVDGGVLYARFWCGPKPYCVAMGPALAFRAIDQARRALKRGVIECLIGDGKQQHQ